MLNLIAASIMASAGQGSMTVPFHLAADAIIVDAAVNGCPLSLMFDTGFGGSLVADQRINLGQPDGTISLRDFVGEFQANTVPIRSLKLGEVPIRGEDPEAVEQPTAHLSATYGVHTDGVLGFQAIENYVTEINFEKQEFVFHPKSYDISKFAPDGKRTFLIKMLPLGQNTVNMPVVTSTGKRMIMTLDTGNVFYATTHRDVLERVGLWDSQRAPHFASTAVVASGPVKTWDIKLDGVTIFGVPVQSCYWNVIELPSSDADADGTVGIQFLKNFNVTVDYDRRLVWLENFTGTAANDPPGGTGIAARTDLAEGAVVVSAVEPGSPAFDAGIQEGDRVLEIDNEEAKPSWSIHQLASRLRGKPGTIVSVAISRAGVFKRYALRRAPMYNW